MNIFTTTKQLSQGIKNIGRLRHILIVFSKKGFAELITRLELASYLPRNLGKKFQGPIEGNLAARRFREALEELGPAFVKFGQILSTRSDLLSTEFTEELTRLQDQVTPIPFEIIEQTIFSELKTPINELFEEFDKTPLAAASIGQVHAARLRTGETVVVKVQRPNIEQIIETDISILLFIARTLERVIPEAKTANPVAFVEEFFRTIQSEIDYRIEANNMIKMSKNLAEFNEIKIPLVYRSISTSKVLISERLFGIRVNDIAAIDAAGVDRRNLVSIGARAFFKTVLIDGVFHGDLHGGNLFVLPDGRLGIIDFGMVGRLSPRARETLAAMVTALVSEDYESLCLHYAELGKANMSIDFESFVREVQNTLSPHLGLSISEINAGKILMEATRVATKYQIRVPGEWMLVFKAILTVEGMGRSLDPDFDYFSHGQVFIKEMVKQQLNVSKISRELYFAARDGVQLLQLLPRQIRWMLQKFNSNEFALEIKSPELRQWTREYRKIQRRHQLVGLSGAALIAAAIASLNTQSTAFIYDWNLMSAALLISALALSLIAFFR